MMKSSYDSNGDGSFLINTIEFKKYLKEPTTTEPSQISTRRVYHREDMLHKHNKSLLEML